MEYNIPILKNNKDIYPKPSSNDNTRYLHLPARRVAYLSTYQQRIGWCSRPATMPTCANDKHLHRYRKAPISHIPGGIDRWCLRIYSNNAQPQCQPLAKRKSSLSQGDRSSALLSVFPSIDRLFHQESSVQGTPATQYRWRGRRAPETCRTNHFPLRSAPLAPWNCQIPVVLPFLVKRSWK